MTNYRYLIFQVILLGLLLTLTATSCRSLESDFLTPDERAWLHLHENELEILIGYDDPPYGYYNDDGQYIGIVMDHSAEVESRLGIRFVPKYFDTWDELVEYSKTGRNFVVAGIAQTDSREAYLSVTDPLIKEVYVIVTSKNSDLATMDDLVGRKVCTVANYAINEYLARYFPQITPELHINNLLGLRAVATGDCEAIVISQLTASYLIDSQGFANLKIAGESGYVNRLGLGVSLNDPFLFNIIDKTVDQIPVERQQEIYRKWVNAGSVGIPQSVFTGLAIATGITTAVLAILWLWSMSLRRQVRAQTRQIAASEEKFRSYVEYAPVGIFIVDENGNYVDVNLAAEKITGYNRSELLAMNLIELIAPEDQPQAKVHFDTVREIGKATADLPFLKKDGSQNFWTVDAVKLSDSRFLGFVTDISHRKQADEALRESLENMAEAQRIAHFGSWEIALTPELGFANPQKWSDECYRIFGVEPGSVEITKEFFYDYVHPDDRDLATQTLLNAIHTGTEATYEYRIIQPGTSSIRYVVDRVKIVTEPKTGRPIKVIGTVNDITERKQLEEENKKLTAQFYQAQKMEAIGQLAGGIAHDFNNLLVPIIGYAELGQMNLQPDDPLLANFTHITAAANRAASLTRQILAFSRQQMLDMRQIDLNEVVTGFQKMLTRLLREDISLHLHLNPQLRPIKADQGQIEQVLLNLVVNARDAMSDGGILTIETDLSPLDEMYAKTHPDTRPGLYVMLAVSDTGHGMDNETQRRIFEPFFTTKGRGRGTGLGLATVFGIVKQHHGNIWVYSEPGRGTTFKIYLPVVEEPTAPPVVQKSTSAEQLTGSETVLVVEDEVGVRQLVVHTLQTHGYNILEAIGPNEALELATSYSEPIHLLLTDVVMPGLNGRQLYTALAKQFSTLKVLYMSGYTDNVIVHHGALDPDVAFLAKPFAMISLLRKVREVLS